MRKMLHMYSLTVMLALLPRLPLRAQSSQTQTRTQEFLNAYIHGDTKEVLSVIDKNTVVYGSDEAEVFRGKTGVATMLQQDARLWGDVQLLAR